MAVPFNFENVSILSTPFFFFYYYSRSFSCSNQSQLTADKIRKALLYSFVTLETSSSTCSSISWVLVWVFPYDEPHGHTYEPRLHIMTTACVGWGFNGFLPRRKRNWISRWNENCYYRIWDMEYSCEEVYNWIIGSLGCLMASVNAQNNIENSLCILE